METLVRGVITKKHRCFFGTTWFERTASRSVFSTFACPWTSDYVETRQGIHNDLARVGIDALFYFDPDIVSLPAQVTAQQLQEYERKYGKSISAIDYVAHCHSECVAFQMASVYRQLMGSNDWGLIDDASADKSFIKSVAASMPAKPDAFAQKCARWSPNYGTISTYNASESIKAVREYLLCLSPCPEIYLSLVQSVDESRMYFGFRQGGGTCFPIDHKTKWGLSINPEHAGQILEGTQAVMQTITDFVRK